jgi:hypothetical protein
VTLEEEARILDIDARLTDVAYQHAQFAVQRSTEHFARLDTKATTLSGIVGVITTVLLAVAPSAFWHAISLSRFLLASAVFIVIALASLFGSMGFCIAALRIRQVQDVPSIREVLEALRTFERNRGDDIVLKKRLLLPLSRVDYGFAFEAQQKAHHLRVATNWLIVAFIALALAGLCFTVDLSIELYGRHRATVERISPRTI